MTSAAARGVALPQLHALQQALQPAQRATGARQLDGADRPQRRAHGAFYTPAPLVEFVTRLVLQPWLTRASGSTLVGNAGASATSAALTVLDPAAGDGRFLRCADELLRGSGGLAPTLIGIERDAATAQATRAALAPASIYCREALLDAPALPLVDVVLGNPPYARSVSLRQRDPVLWQGLRKRFAATSVGEWDVYGAFIEKALQWVRPGGRVGMVVPSRWLTAQFASGLRAQVGAHVESIVDFGCQQLFADATTYIAVVVMQRAPGAASVTASQSVAVAHHHARMWNIEMVPRSALANVAAPWSLRSTTPLRIGELTLGDVADVVKGVGTNADSVFVVEPVAADGALTQVRTAQGRLLWLESAALQPVWRGRDVGQAAPVRCCIFPYRNGVLIDPATLAGRFPCLATYFDEHRAALQARERGRFTGPTFYCFGRPQNFAFLLAPLVKVVVPDVTAGGRASLDCGSLVLDSAYALRPRANAPVGYQALPWWRALLSSPMVRLWLQTTGVSLRGGYVRMKTAYLRNLPLPAVGPALDASITAALAGDEAGSHEALRVAYGMTRQAWTA
ncbi:MAG: Eco57I restriction-modification methylase domain-containing protein [Kofleriaceae bacterium]|nr:Eco57I restriction-modification methylase domain-containing protein [Kofleriaceae bacterium]